MQSNNTTGTFTGTIICAPSALVFLGSSTLMFYGSAGGEALSAAMNDQPSWVTTFSHTWDASTTLLRAELARAGAHGIHAGFNRFILRDCVL